jgi:poly(3-hydroxybutyrate) depolymerase
MDLAAEFYLQTVDTVFIRHALPKGEMTHRGRRVDPTAIRRVALMTVEGENDDISSVGQTEAAHALCVNIPQEHKVHYVQPAVGHYGVFNGSRFRAEIAPRIADFVLSRNGARTVRTAVLKVVGCPSAPCSIAATENRRRFPSISMVRSIPFACAGIGRRAATRCASMR